MLTINKTIKVTHKSQDFSKVIEVTGKVLGDVGALSLRYEESDGASVVLDATDKTCVLRRYGEWGTTCYFSKSEAWIRIESKEGILNFEIELVEMTVQDRLICIVYRLDGQLTNLSWSWH